MQTLVHEGGLVPKTLYKTLSEEDEADGAPIHDNHHSLYQSADLKPGHIHEVVITNDDPKSVLTWDFDVIKSDLKFNVFRTSKTLPNIRGKWIEFLASDHRC